MKYVIYLRVSKDTLDLRTQLLKCLNFVKSFDKTDFEYEIFTDEKSAYRYEWTKRQGFVNAINTMQEGDIFVSTKTDRISRRWDEVAMIAKMMERRGVGLKLVDQPGIDSPLVLAVYAASGEIESKNTSGRVKDKFKLKRSLGECLGGHKPYGWTVDNENLITVMRDNKPVQIAGKLIPHPEEQKALALMNEYHRMGLSYRQIAHKMTDHRIWNRKGRPFDHASIYKILKRQDHNKSLLTDLQAQEAALIHA